jgi:peptide methionine sulfoxide reductase MsrA
MKEERAILAGGCFWGMQDLIAQARRRDRSPTASGGMGGATERGRLRFRSSALRREQSYKGSLASIKLGA